ncbi:MAG: hypothetical protein KBT21_06315 [Treponema sp.]|nr:hypothetical protein [Candidatus Treponema merdequi]
MKKNRNDFKSKLIVSLLICFTAVLFMTACKTVPKIEIAPPDAFDVLDDEGAMYISIPASENSELLEKFITGFTPGVSENDAKTVISKINRVYASFGSRDDKKRICISADADIPKAAAALLKKSGYQEKQMNAEDIYAYDKSVNYYSMNSVEIAFPSPKNVLISRDVKPMIQDYVLEENIQNGLMEFSTDYKSSWYESDLYQWIKQDTDTIHFYIVRPQSFLSNLLGSAVSTKTFKLNYAKGQFAKLPNSKYELTLELSFQDQKFIKPAMALLSLALGLTDSELEQVNLNTVKLGGVHINTKQLINMFGL